MEHEHTQVQICLVSMAASLCSPMFSLLLKNRCIVDSYSISKLKSQMIRIIIRPLKKGSCKVHNMLILFFFFAFSPICI